MTYNDEQEAERPHIDNLPDKHVVLVRNITLGINSRLESLVDILSD